MAAVALSSLLSNSFVFNGTTQKWELKPGTNVVIEPDGSISLDLPSDIVLADDLNAFVLEADVTAAPLAGAPTNFDLSPTNNSPSDTKFLVIQGNTIKMVDANYLSRTIASGVLTPSSSVPSAPGQPSVVSMTATLLTVSWPPTSGGVGTAVYQPELSTDNGVTWTIPNGTTTATQTAFVTTGGQHSKVRIRASVNGVNSDYSALLDVTSPTGTSTPPAPANLHTVVETNNPGSTTWHVQANTVTGVGTITYEAEWSVDAFATPHATTGLTSPEYTFTGLTANAVVQARMRAKDGATAGPYSSIITVQMQPSAGVLAAPTNPIEVSIASNALSVQTDAISAAIGTLPANPGIACPAVSMAPSSSYTVKNLYWRSSALDDPGQAGNIGFPINIACTGCTVTLSLFGSLSIASGANNSASMQVIGLAADIKTLLATGFTINNPSGTTGTRKVDLNPWDNYGQSINGTITITSVAGTAVETGGYNPTGGVTYVYEIAPVSTGIYTALAASSTPAGVFTGLNPSTDYTWRGKGVTGAGVSGSYTTPRAVTTTATGSIKSDAAGITATRAYDWALTFGTNMFPNGQDVQNRSGINKAASIAAEDDQINYLMGTGGSWTGLDTHVRVYTSSGDGKPAQMAALVAAAHVKIAPCCDHYIGSNSGGVMDIVTAVGAANIYYVQGPNEPNTDFGGGTLTPAQTIVLQEEVWNACHTTCTVVAAPVAGVNGTQAANWWGTYKTRLLAACHAASSHLYPNNGAYQGANQMYDWTRLVSDQFGNKDVYMTETQATLYNSSYSQAHTNDGGGYWEMAGHINMTLRGVGTPSGSVFKGKAFTHFAMNDYLPDFPINVGLFNYDNNTPHPIAVQYKALFALIADTNAAKKTFVTGKLNIRMTGGQSSGDQYSGGFFGSPLQTADGDFFVPLVNEQTTLSSTNTTWTIYFDGQTPTSVELYRIADPFATANPVPTAATSWSAAQINTAGKTISVPMHTEIAWLRVVLP